MLKIRIRVRITVRVKFRLEVFSAKSFGVKPFDVKTLNHYLSYLVVQDIG